MRSLVAALAALAMLGFAAVAHAAETSGRIISADSNMLVLEDGSAYALAEGVSVEGLQPGTLVTISYEEQNGQKIATAVVAAQ